MSETNDTGEIFRKNNLTDFEKLLFANAHIKELDKNISEAQIENGKLHSEVEELKYSLSQKPDNAKIANQKNQIKRLCDSLKKEKGKNEKLLFRVSKLQGRFDKPRFVE